MILFLLLALTFSRPYHHTTVDQMPTVHRTHIEVAGKVTLVAREADGDIHIRVSDAHGHFIVAEIPYGSSLNTAANLARLRQVLRAGGSISVSGVRRFDDDHGHGWWECHPVEQWKVQGVRMGGGATLGKGQFPPTHPG